MVGSVLFAWCYLLGDAPLHVEASSAEQDTDYYTRVPGWTCLSNRKCFDKNWKVSLKPVVFDDFPVWRVCHWKSVMRVGHPAATGSVCHQSFFTWNQRPVGTLTVSLSLVFFIPICRQFLRCISEGEEPISLAHGRADICSWGGEYCFVPVSSTLSWSLHTLNLLWVRFGCQIISQGEKQVKIYPTRLVGLCAYSVLLHVASTQALHYSPDAPLLSTCLRRACSMQEGKEHLPHSTFLAAILTLFVFRTKHSC